MKVNKSPIILLIGGKGSRYIDEKNYPKQLALVNNKPILIHMMNSYFRSGFNFFILPLGHKKEIFKKFFFNPKNKTKYKLNILNKKLNNFKNYSLNILLFNTKNNITKYERIQNCLKYINIYKHVGINYGDAICNINIKSVYKKFLNEKISGIISVAFLKSPFGHVMLKNKLVKNFEEKPYLTIPTNIGYYFFNTSELINYKKRNAELETDFLKYQIKKKKLGFFLHKGYFKTVNKKQDLDNINKK